MTAGTVQIRMAAYQFRAKRADYYEYLADLLGHTGGQLTLRQIMLADAARYGSTPRGILSAHWADRYDDNGNLTRTFAGTLPAADVAVLATLQEAGHAALAEGLRDLAGLTRLMTRARTEFVGTVLVGAVCALALLVLLAAIPLFTVPELQSVFRHVPAEHYGAAAQRLFGFADWLQRYAAYVLAGIALLAWLIASSVTTLTGPLRDHLDRFGIWRLYRQLCSIRLLSTLAIVLRQRGSTSLQLREALQMQQAGATGYLRHHLDRLIARVDDSHIGASTFDTGMLERETVYYLDDVIHARGMDAGIQLARNRTETHLLAQVKLRAVILRWALALSSVLAIVAIALWHTIVQHELVAVMKLLG